MKPMNMKKAARAKTIVSAGGGGSPEMPEASGSEGWLEGARAILDAKRRVVEVNPALADWLAQDAAACQGKRLEDLFQENHPEWTEPIRACLANVEHFQRINLLSSAGPRKCWFCLEIARNAAGYFMGLDSILPPENEPAENGWYDLLQTDPGQRNLFARMHRLETLLKQLANNWPGVIFCQRADFSFPFVSPKIEELTGVSAAEWHDQPQRFWQVVHESDAEELRQQLKRIQQVPHGVTTTYRIRHIHTGRVAYVLEHRQAVTSGSGSLLGYEGVWLDVTRQTIAEKRLSAAAWKETLAVLTMGLAHDFSNIMAGIHSLSESFLAQVNSDHAFHEGLTLIRQHSLQANQLVRRIINLHHGKTGERNYHDLNEIVSDLVDLAQKILPRRVQITALLAPEELPLYVDAVEFRQVIINLTLNAADAMPQGGKLFLETSMHREFPVCGHVEGAWPRLPAVSLTVEDSGCGISPRHLASIFDPFFTTKAINKGSGLGLYNARLFIEKHRGAISVDSTEGIGTTFRIWLPQADFTEAEQAVAAESHIRRSLLLVGAAGKLRDDIVEFLRLHSYHVVVANHEGKAIEDLQNSDYQFAGLMILLEPKDAQLAALVNEVRRRFPSLKVIIHAVGCNQEALADQVLRQSDLILSPDMSGGVVLAKLKTVFERGVYR
jgi:PAS domain S-box-containing protein